MKIFTKNKYYKLYKNIILKAKKETRFKGCGIYYESHHIFPKSLYPLYIKSKHNLVLLTAKEHYVCHHLLTKFTSGTNKVKMTYSFWRMIHTEKQSQRITAKVYESVKRQIVLLQIEKLSRNDNTFTFKGCKHSDESLKQISIASIKTNKIKTAKSIKRIKNLLSDNEYTFLKMVNNRVHIKCKCGNEFDIHRQYITPSKFTSKLCKKCFPKTPMTQMHRDKIGKAHKGKVVSKETKEKLRQCNLGKKASIETKKKLSEQRKGKFKGKSNAMYNKKHKQSSIEKMIKNRSGLNHPSVKGEYITPWGNFITTKEAVIAYNKELNHTSLRKWCKANNNKTIRRQSYLQCEYLNKLGEEVIGKTFNEIGFGYELF